MVVNCGNARGDRAAIGLSTEQRPADPASCRWNSTRVGPSDFARLFRLSRCTRPASLTCATEFVHGVGLPPRAAIPRARGFRCVRLRPNSTAGGIDPAQGSLDQIAEPGRFSVLSAGTRLPTGGPLPHRGIGNETPTRQTPADRPRSVALSLHQPHTIPAVSAVSYYSPRFVRAQSIRHRPRPDGAQTRRFAGVARA